MTYKTLRTQYEEYKKEKGIKALSKESLKWFLENARALAGKTDYQKTKVLGKMSAKPIPGKFYLYKYDPKTKDKLPMYDILPLVLITRVTPKGWYGINFHYMPPAIRLAIMEALYATINDKTKSDRVKLKMNWQIAQAVAVKVGANEHLGNSIKQYLSKQVRSRGLLEIDPYYWSMVLFLNLGRFKLGGGRKK